jgi:quercetin dioxygenase-like cupin family protein
VISGKLELKLKKAEEETAEIEKIILEPGDLVEIQPYVIHSLTAIEDSEFFVFTSEFRIDKDYENDTFRVDI